jgi:hypothetical protein
MTQSIQLVGIDAWCAQLAAADRVTGPLVDRLVQRLPAGVEAMPASTRVPLAGTVAKLAWQKWQRGERDELWRLVPVYIRASAAEERLHASNFGHQ